MSNFDVHRRTGLVRVWIMDEEDLQRVGELDELVLALVLGWSLDGLGEDRV